MTTTLLNLGISSKLERVLCLGAHADDIEIGCGGTLLKLGQENPSIEFRWVVFSAVEARADEARLSAETLLADASDKTTSIKAFTESRFPAQDAEQIKDDFEDIKHDFVPDLVLTHYREDRHQDHRILSDLTWNTFRHHFILEYEIPKYDGDLGVPNAFVQLSGQIARAKSEHICRYFQTQSDKHWFSEDTFMSLMRLRGMECASPSGFAEAFYCRKCVL